MSAASPAHLVANCHNVDDVVKVLGGLKGRDQQRYAAEVTKLALLRFSDADQVSKIATAAADSPDLRPIIVEQILHRAAELESKSTTENRDSPRGPHHQAGAYVLCASKLMQGEELGALISQKLSPKEGEQLALTLDVRHPSGANGIFSPVRHQILSALNKAPRTDTTGAFVKKLNLLLLPEDVITYCPDLAVSLATALGREFYPQSQLGRSVAIERAHLQPFLEMPEGAALLLTGTEERRQRVIGVLQRHPEFTVATFANHNGPWVTEPRFAHALAEEMVPADAPNRAGLVQHVGEILATEQGQEIRFGWYGFDKNINLKARVEAMQAIIGNGITAADLQKTKDPWENEALVKGIAATRMAGIQEKFRVDAPRKFRTREELTAFVADTAGLPPDHPKVKSIVDQLLAQGGSEPVVSFRPVFFSSRTTGVVQFPLYRTDIAYSFGPNRSGQNQFLPDQTLVDDTGRAYKTEPHTSAFAHWQGKNELPPGVVVAPRGGRISRDKNGALELEQTDTPEKSPEKLVTGVMMVGGIFAGGATLVGAGGWLVRGIGAVSSLYGAGNAIAEREDRRQHGQSNAWSDPAGRAGNFNLAASIAGVAVMGVGPILKGTLYGGELTHEMALGASLVNTTGAATDAAAFINGVVDLAQNYRDMPEGQFEFAFAQLIGQGLMSGAGIAQAGGIRPVFNPMAGARALIAEHLPPPRIVYGDTTVKGNAVEIRLVDDKYVIFAGEHADQARIDHHVNVVRQLEGDITFTEMLGRWVGRRSNKEITTAIADIRKLDSWIAQQTLALQSHDLPPGKRGEIEEDITVCKQKRAELEKRVAELRSKPDADRGGQAIQLPDSRGGSGANIRFVRTPAYNLVDELGAIDRSEFARAVRETGANTLNEPERIIDWFVKNQKFAKRSWLDRALSMPDYEKAWQRFLQARAAAHPSSPNEAIPTMPPEWRLSLALGDIDQRAYQRAIRETGGADPERLIDWFVKNEGLGTNPKYEQVWQKYLSSLAKERQDRQTPQRPPSPLPWQQPVRQPMPPVAVPPTPDEPSLPEQTAMQGAHPALQDQGVRGHVVAAAAPASKENTHKLVNQLMASIGGRRSQPAQHFIGTLRAQVEALQHGNEPLTVKGFIDLVGRTAHEQFGLTGGADIARTMADLVTRDPHVVSSDQLKDNSVLDATYLLSLLN